MQTRRAARKGHIGVEAGHAATPRPQCTQISTFHRQWACGVSEMNGGGELSGECTPSRRFARNLLFSKSAKLSRDITTLSHI